MRVYPTRIKNSSSCFCCVCVCDVKKKVVVVVGGERQESNTTSRENEGIARDPFSIRLLLEAGTKCDNRKGVPFWSIYSFGGL